MVSKKKELGNIKGPVVNRRRERGPNCQMPIFILRLLKGHGSETDRQLLMMQGCGNGKPTPTGAQGPRGSEKGEAQTEIIHVGKRMTLDP